MATALPGTGVPVSTDILTTLNGVAATANEAIQRIKVSTGVPGTATDVSAANPLPVSLSAETTKVIGTVNLGLAIAPIATQDDDKQYDDDGYPYVNTNVPGADVATGDKQTQILNALALLLATPGALGTIQNIAPITVAAINSIPLAANAAVENVGNLQKISDMLELMLVELRVIGISITQLSQPIQDGSEQLRNDFNSYQ